MRDIVIVMGEKHVQKARVKMILFEKVREVIAGRVSLSSNWTLGKGARRDYLSGCNNFVGCCIWHSPFFCFILSLV